jgi:hypothetical protein
MRIHLAYADGRRRSLEYDLRQAANSGGMHDTAAAFGIAMNRLMRQLLADLENQ